MNEMVFGSLATTEKRVNYLQKDRRGVRHQNQLTPRVPQAGEQPTITVTVELPQSIDRVICTITEPETAVLPLTHVDTRWDLINWTYYQAWQASLPAFAAGTLVRYRLDAYPVGSGAPIPADDGATFAYLVGAKPAPDWAAEAVIYQILPDRFHPGNGRSWRDADTLHDVYGGTLRGIIQHLDYVAEMGFNCIWLNPFFPDDTHHGYHATDYFAVNPRLGTLADVRELVTAAHDRGMRLLLDFVANHWSNEHKTFLAAQSDLDSPYRNWYHWREWPHDYETFFDVQELPQLNTDHPDVRAHLFDSLRFWLGDVGFDGLRLDYVLGPSLDFWTALRATVDAIRPDAWIYGEAVDTPSAQLAYDGRFHGTLDFLLAQAMRRTFAFGTMDIVAFDAFLNQHETFFPTHFSRPSFLDNHDMNRFLWIAGGDKRKLKLAALCQFTLAGMPIVYSGSEVGVNQTRDKEDPVGVGMAEVRQPMAWGVDQDADLRDYFRWLVHFRRQHPTLWRGLRQTLHVDAAGLYVYSRQDETEMVLVGLNLGDNEREITVTLPATAVSHTFHLSAWHGDVAVFPAAKRH